MNTHLRSDELALFVRVVEHGSFAAAAEETGLTASGVSKAVTRLEDRLGVRLLHRTTRRVALTAEGDTLLARARDVLAALESAEAEVTAARGRPRGLLRVNTGTAFAKRRLVGWMPEFHTRYPDITLDLTIADRRIDVIGEQVDIAIRTGPPGDSALIIRPLLTTQRVIAASPHYLARAGVPTTREAVHDHTCIVVAGLGRTPDWPLLHQGRVTPTTIRAAFACDNADVVRDLAIAGLGLCRLARFMLDDALADGRLVTVLDDLHVSESVDIYAVMPPGRQHLPRVRAFLDFIADKVAAGAKRGN
ncbi:MAG: LysR substrate-binding domain-containing protein [Alphaproteobacteria bacterium]|nr:LysR substrate-binding domain-containing protein [Alphaproteobacteria bacterium]